MVVVLVVAVVAVVAIVVAMVVAAVASAMRDVSMGDAGVKGKVPLWSCVLMVVGVVMPLALVCALWLVMMVVDGFMPLNSSFEVICC